MDCNTKCGGVRLPGWFDVRLFVFLHSVKCSCCYMVCAAEGSSLSHSRSNVRLEIGCLVDTATGFLTFTANGKELGIFYQVFIPVGYVRT